MENKWKLANYANDQIRFDSLHRTGDIQQNQCSDKVCRGSMLDLPGVATKTRTQESASDMANTFCNEYYTSIDKFGSNEHTTRCIEMKASIAKTGTYRLTEPELVFGVKLAWRNASRCIGRIQWNKLKVLDGRDVTTTKQMFDILCTHLSYATNGGNIRSAITMFPPREEGKPDFRIWNYQLINYAGYRNDDETIVGDPYNIEFTKICLRLGWKSDRTMWDVLPLVLSAGGDPELFELPPELVLQIPLAHPSYGWFKDLNLRWYAVPAVSKMLADIGGIQFPACAFNGWYMGTEIGCRDLCDRQRYNVLEMVATEMGEDTSSDATLWKDRALVEVNVAVLHSFQRMKVTIVDHHTASENFMKHLENESNQRKGCPADWVWIVPPMSASATPLFHQEMALYYVKPSFEYQEPAWQSYAWKPSGEARATTRLSFRQVANDAWFCTNLYAHALRRRVNVSILYATMTGKSQMYAAKLARILACRLNPKVHCMADYDAGNLVNESLVLIVTSTFGNGDSPDNGFEFSSKLEELIAEQVDASKSKDSVKIIPKGNVETFKHLRFSVFALGSSVYPHFCAFGHHIDAMLDQLGAERLMPVGEGDEMRGQNKAFAKWYKELYPLTCNAFGLTAIKEELEKDLTACEVNVSEEMLRFVRSRELLLDTALSKTIQKCVRACKVLKITNLHREKEHGTTILVEVSSSLVYEPGDHVGIMPKNDAELVQRLLDRMENVGNPNIPVKLQMSNEARTDEGTVRTWAPYGQYPPCSLRKLLTRFVDITTPLWPSQLDFLATLAKDPAEQSRLLELSQDTFLYEDWRSWSMPTVVDVLNEFPSVRVVPTILLSLLKSMEPRFYSISSSPEAHAGQIHLTVSVVVYKTEEGNGESRYGVCSNYLNRCKPGDNIYMFVRRGRNFSLPDDVSKPIIMIGPGTGIAPFRGFWQQRRSQLQISRRDSEEPKIGETWLFFGCRTKKTNLFADEKTRMVDEGVIQKEFLALSREQGVPKTYVQTLFERQGGEVYRKLSEEGGHLFVCGEVAMAEGVHNMLLQVLMDHGNMDEKHAAIFVAKLKTEHRYHEDIFGVTTHGVNRKLFAPRGQGTAEATGLEPTRKESELKDLALVQPTLLEPTRLEPTRQESELKELALVQPTLLEPTRLKLTRQESELEELALVQPTLLEPTCLEPTRQESDLKELTLVQPTSVQPTLLEPRCLEPTRQESELKDLALVQPTLLEPTRLEPTRQESELKELALVQPTLLEPTRLKPTRQESELKELTLVQPTSVQQTLLEARRLEPTGLELTRKEPTHVQPTRKESTRLEPTHIQSTRVEPTHLQPTRKESTRLEPTHLQPTRKESICLEPTHLQPTRKESTRLEPTHLQPTRKESTRLEPTHLQPRHTESTHVHSSHVQPTHVQPRHVQPTHVGPTRLEPTNAQPTRVPAAAHNGTTSNRRRRRVAQCVVI